MKEKGEGLEGEQKFSLLAGLSEMTEAPGCLWFAWRRISQNFAESYKFGKGLTGTNFVTINPFDLLNGNSMIHFLILYNSYH